MSDQNKEPVRGVAEDVSEICTHCSRPIVGFQKCSNDAYCKPISWSDEDAVKAVYPDAKIGRDHHSAYYAFTKQGAGGRISEYVGSDALAWKSARSKLKPEPTPTLHCDYIHCILPHGHIESCLEAAEPNPVRTPASDVLNALIALRSFMWSEGYADQTPAMAQADAAIAASEDMEISLDGTSADAPVDPERQTSRHTADKA